MSENKLENKTSNIEQILEKGKNPGLGIKELHRQGINGEGVFVAIIDQKLDLQHPEYAHSIIDYQEYGKATQEEISMHGPAVASLLTGKNCGTAPHAKLIYKAVPSGTDFGPNFIAYAQALNDIIIDQQTKIVSVSIGYDNDKHLIGESEWLAALKRAKKAGVVVITVKNYLINDVASGGGSSTDKEDPDTYLPWSGSTLEDKTFEKLILDEKFDQAIKHLQEFNDAESKKFSNQELLQFFPTLRKKINSRQNNPIIIPSDHRTIAKSPQEKNLYVYDEKGGLSWAIPYLAGVFALCLQVNPKLTENKLFEILNESAIVNKNGLKVINPKGMIDLVREKV